jgi:hypothetical protein
MTRIAVFGFVVALAPGVRSATAQAQPVEWKDLGIPQAVAEEIGDRDRTAILRLAQRLGMDAPRRVAFTMGLPGACLYVRVESAVTVQGVRRTWREQRLRRQDWRRCEEEPRSSRLKEGRWIGSRTQVTVRVDERPDSRAPASFVAVRNLLISRGAAIQIPPEQAVGMREFARQTAGGHRNHGRQPSALSGRS